MYVFAPGKKHFSQYDWLKDDALIIHVTLIAYQEFFYVVQLMCAEKRRCLHLPLHHYNNYSVLIMYCNYANFK